MTLQEVARIPLPGHVGDGGFDHAAIDGRTDRLYVAHTPNDAVEVVDLAARRHLRSIRGVGAVAGVWVDAEARLLFTSNRGEDTASVFRLADGGETELFRVPTGSRPNGMAFDPARGIWMIAGVGNAKVPDAPPSLTFVDLEARQVVGRLRAPGRTRWATYHAPTEAFYVNVADPPSILSVAADDRTKIHRSFPMPVAGPHGMEQDPDGSGLFCACDAAVLLRLDVRSGAVTTVGPLAGPPDVLWADGERRRLYAATDEPATVDVFGTGPPAHRETFAKSPGAHTLTVDPKRHEVHVFLPETCEDLVLADRAD